MLATCIQNFKINGGIQQAVQTTCPQQKTTSRNITFSLYVWFMKKIHSHKALTLGLFQKKSQNFLLKIDIIGTCLNSQKTHFKTMVHQGLKNASINLWIICLQTMTPKLDIEWHNFGMRHAMASWKATKTHHMHTKFHLQKLIQLDAMYNQSYYLQKYKAADPSSPQRMP